MITRHGAFRITMWLLPLLLLAWPAVVHAQTTCSVLFDAQGGAAPNPSGTNVTVGSPYGALATTLRSGYSFEGWWTAGGGAGSRVTADTIVTNTVEHTLYAKWLARSYLASFDAQGGSAPGPANKLVVFDSAYGPLATSLRSGYTLSGWWTEPGGAGTEVTSASTVAVTNNHTLYAKWTANSYTVTFDPQDGDTPIPASIRVTFDSTYGKLATLTRSGYVFDGWWTGAGGTGSRVTAGTTVTITADQTLYAKWTATSYTVTFDAQGGQAPSPASTTVTGALPYGPLAVTTRSGYTFAGWWTQAGGTGAAVTPGTIVAITADQTLYAKWTANSYTVTFDAQGGSAPGPANKTVVFDSPYGTLAATTRSGYTLSGWWTEPGGEGTEVTSLSTVAVTQNHTVYAKWTANRYIVTFDAQGGDAPVPASKSVTFDSVYGTLASVTRPGYTFEGWWTGAGGVGTKVTASTVVAITANQTLYAKWTVNGYTVTFDAQGGGTPSPAGKSVTFDTPYGALATTARSGYTFAGWWTQAGGAGAMVTEATVVKITADQTLYAKWTAQSFTVTFDAQGGSAPNPAVKNVTFDSSYGTLATTARAGYTFEGWWTEAGGAGTAVTAATMVTLTANQILYAKWTANSYTVTFNAQGGEAPSPASKSVTFDTPYGKLGTTTRIGYAFEGWWTEPGGLGALVTAGTVFTVPNNQVLYAKWTANRYTVTFDAQEGSAPNPASKSVAFDTPYGTLAATARRGYTFEGWWTEAGGAGALVTAGTVYAITNHQALYAKWTVNSYTVTFDAQGGSAPSPAGKSVTFDSPYGKLATTTRTGYSFAGWWTGAGGMGTRVTTDTIVEIAANQTLYAKWAANQYTVTFDAQGGQAPSPASTTVTVDLPYGPLAATTRSGYTFAGWWTQVGGTGAAVTPGTIVTITADQTLYAKWTANSYTVTFDAQGGSAPGPANKTVVFDSPYGTLAATTRSGYTLSGWWTEPGGEGTEVTSLSTVAVTQNHTVYAKWTANHYTVTFDAQGGDAPVPASKSVTFDSVYGTLASVTRPGYTFAGWWTGAGGVGTKVTASTVVAITANQILYAKWTATSYTVTFDAQGGQDPSPASADVTFDSPYGELATITRPGYTFAGWWTAAGGAGSLVTAATIVTIAADQTLYAKWTANSYTVSFNAQGGSAPSPAVKTVTFDSPYGILATTAFPGYTFDGWWTETNGAGTEVASVSMVTVKKNHTLYAKWTANSYTVTFDAQGGEAPVPSIKSVTFGSPYGKLGTATREGYTFEGWWTGVGGAGAKVTTGTIVAITANQTLYAKWTANRYMVLFDAQEGSDPNPASTNVTFDSPYGRLAATTRLGYTFAGWWTEIGDAGSMVTTGTIVKITADQTLYAKWTAKSYAVTFDSQGGSAPIPAGKSVIFDSPYGALATTARPGYTFAGWWTEAEGAGTEVTSTTMVALTANQILYAKWTANSYRVTFDAQDGDAPSPASKSVTFDTPYGKLGTTARSGYTFAGWWTGAGGAGTMVTAGTIVKITADQTLYAKWTANRYTVIFDAQGGSVPDPVNKAVLFDSPYGTLATTARPGYTFAGWWTEADGAGSMVNAGTIVKITADQTLYAKWTANSYTVAFDAQGGSALWPASKTVLFDSPYGTLATTARAGYSFAGWWTGPGGAGTRVTAGTVVALTANQTLYAKWAANAYTVTFDSQGGEAPSPASKSVTFDAPYGTLATTARPGYTFAGWWTEPAGAGTMVNAATIVKSSADQTLYAKWTAISCTVAFDPQGGIAPSPASKSVTFDLTYGPLPTSARSGYTFAGWWTEADGAGVEVTALSWVAVPENHTLYAKWTANTVAVLFDAQGGSAPWPSANILVTFGSSYGELAFTKRPGYNFLGWWTGIGGTGTEVSSGTAVKNAADHTLYAKWAATGKIRFAMLDFMATEGNKLKILVERVNGSNGVVSVNYKMKAQTALPWQDYIPKAGTLEWEDGEMGVKEIRVSILQDWMAERYEQFLVLLKNPIGAPLGNPSEATVIIPAQKKIPVSGMKDATAVRMTKLTKAVDAETQTWFTSAQAPWVRQPFLTTDGVDAGMSGATTLNQVSWLQTDVEGAGTLDFDWLVKGMGADACVVLVDGTVVRTLGPGPGWAHETVALGAGDHVIRWVFAGDAGLSGGAAYLDQVRWTPERE